MPAIISYPYPAAPSFFSPHFMRAALRDDYFAFASTGNATPTANLALYLPITLDCPTSITSFYWANGGTASGHMDVGLYSLDGTKLGTSTGSIAQSGTTAVQSAVPSGGSFSVGPGNYYVAIQCDASTANLWVGSTLANADIGRGLGILQQAVGSFGLPATATFAANATTPIPIAGIIGTGLPGVRAVSPLVIHPFSVLCGAGIAAANAGATNSANGATSGTWPAANRALYVAINIPSPIVLAQAFVHAGATSVNTNHFDIGIYAADHGDNTKGIKVFSTGSTAWSGSTNVLNVVDITDLSLPAGLYYMALALDTNTDTVFRVANGSLGMIQTMGIRQQAAAFALPTTCTFAATAAAFTPFFGFTQAATI